MWEHLPRSVQETILRRELRFFGEEYNAIYEVLQRFPTAGAAQALYPEGLRLSASSPAVLHWQRLDDPAAKNIESWSRGN